MDISEQIRAAAEAAKKASKTSFTVQMGGSKTAAGSFLSVSSGKAYTMSSLGDASDVEIVFDGTAFKSATEAKNGKVNSNGNSATITATGATTFEYTTSTGFAGVITVDAALGNASKVYNVTVEKQVK